MLARWAGLIARRRWWVLSFAAALAVLAGTASMTLTDRMDQGGYDVPGSESVRAADVASDALGGQQIDALAVYTLPEGRRLTEPAVQNAVRRVVADLPEEDVASASGWWEQPALLAADGRTGAVAIRLHADDQNGKVSTWPTVERALSGGDGGDGDSAEVYGVAGLDVRFSGWAAMGAAVNDQTESDLARAELVSFPLLLVLLVVVFGGLVAAGLPLLVGAVGIVGALGVLWVLTTVMDVSVFAMNVVTLLGLGLTIDYGLFVVSRFREELHRAVGTGDVAGGTVGEVAGGVTTDQAAVTRALRVTLATAGRTVCVSGLTVAAALAGLLVFPQPVLRSIGLGGIAAVLVAALCAVTVLPALLAVVGRRVDALALLERWRWAVRVDRDEAAGERGWARIGRAVMRRPAVVTVLVVGALLLAGTPFLRAEFAGVDASVLPKGHPVREATETVRAELPGAAAEAAQVVLVGADGRPPAPAVVQAFAARVGQVDGLGPVAPVGAAGDVVVLSAAVDGDPQADPARAAVTALRDLDPPAGVSEVLVGGPTASLIDTLDAMGDRLPWMLAVLAGAILVLLLLAFGSLVVPVKAVLLSALSLTASFGTMVWIFQDGHGASLLGAEAGPLDAMLPVLMLAVLFGLSTDYELFLLSRIAEAYRSGRSPREAVVEGLRRTGWLISSAALLLGVVVGAFAVSGLTFMKVLGIGMLVAVAVDATIVRGLLVPAILVLLGRAAWWAPGPLARLAGRVSLESADHPAAPTGSEPAATRPGGEPTTSPESSPAG